MGGLLYNLPKHRDEPAGIKNNGLPFFYEESRLDGDDHGGIFDYILHHLVLVPSLYREPSLDGESAQLDSKW